MKTFFPYRFALRLLGFAAIAAVGVVGAAQLQPCCGTPAANAGATASGDAKRTLDRTVSKCNGTFSDGSSVNVTNPIYLNEVPGNQLFCDFFTFAWNQFIYLTQMEADPNNGGMVTPLFLHIAPWYNILLPDNSPPPAPYPGGSTSLATGVAGDDDRLVDILGNIVLHDIRFNKTMYDAIAEGHLYTESLFTRGCRLVFPPLVDSATWPSPCADPLWLPPTGSTTPPMAGSLELKTSWRDFKTPEACPSTSFYCNGRFGLTGMHIVQKTQSHGEWIWASFEHVANVPDCYPYGDSPVSPSSPGGVPWSFFNPTSAGQGVMDSQICEVTGPSPKCNGDPNVSHGGQTVYRQVNICRTDYLPPGGASSTNCRVVPGDPPQQSTNSYGNVACLNATLRPQMHNPWTNYKMIGSQWLRGGIGPTQAFSIRVFQQQAGNLPYLQPVGFPNLANTTIETWLQSGSTGYDPFKFNATQTGCFRCHNLPTAFDGGNRKNDMSHYPSRLVNPEQGKLVKKLLPAMTQGGANQQ
jgi:hypothetical protein